jgi:hypothetical protein
MTRLACLALALVACSKGADNQQKGASSETPTAPTGAETVTGGPVDTGMAPGGAGDGGDSFKLKPAEGTLAIEVPAAKAGAKVVANIVVTPGTGFHVNTEYPTKLKLETADGVTITKAELKAGGPSKEKGDAAEMTEEKLHFAIELTPAAAGSYTVNGSFKFAVCDKDQCLPKKEAIAIQVAAN